MGHGAGPVADRWRPHAAPRRQPRRKSASPCGCWSASKDKDLFLAAGARGHGAIYTERGKFLHIIRKVFVRVSAKLDWFVAKLH